MFLLCNESNCKRLVNLFVLEFPDDLDCSFLKNYKIYVIGNIKDISDSDKKLKNKIIHNPVWLFNVNASGDRINLHSATHNIPYPIQEQTECSILKMIIINDQLCDILKKTPKKFMEKYLPEYIKHTQIHDLKYVIEIIIKNLDEIYDNVMIKDIIE